MELPVGKQPDSLLTPATPQRVFHMDMMQITLLWFFRFTVAFILDGHSRKLLAARVFAKTPRLAIWQCWCNAPPKAR